MNLNDNNRTLPRVIDYVAVIGLPSELNKKPTNYDNLSQSSPNTSSSSSSSASSTSSPLDHQNHCVDDDNQQRRKRLLYPVLDRGELKKQNDPITDITVIDFTLRESVPDGYKALWETPYGNSADLNLDSINAHQMFICVKRSKDDFPITDIGVYYEGAENVLDDCVVIRKTYYSNSANVNNSSLLGNHIYITYRKSREMLCNSYAVTDIQVLIKSKVK